MTSVSSSSSYERSYAAAMTERECFRICRERLEGWRDNLVKEHTTPLLLIGVGHDDQAGHATLLTTEDVSHENLLAVVRGTLRLLESGHWRSP